MKRFIGAAYGIFLESFLDRIHSWQKRFEKDYL